MSNKDRPHVLVLPEDDANRQIANGFHRQVDMTRQRQMREMDRYLKRLIVLLIDFDGKEDRLESAKADIPQHLADRVFVLGSLSKPEALKADLGPYESIGSEMAKDCREETDGTWEHRLLRHNKSELNRLRERVRPILF
jgi:hypothetical protein